ncbi:aldo/keto reductase [Halobacteria archaeon AArc-curdl1]|uniref:Aldo/keto reductase n=1 Tax=Natronosalvus hydrolyticus TaxID=2979988 RepID=A0AAP2Z6V2_9EURY|nr:aldo/keto reductase [Halobacteria archaeon AArc-curdl1]
METTLLGQTGESVSELALGTIYFGSTIDAETSADILDTYYEAGGRFFDSANNYPTWLDGYDEPESEYFLGEWIEERGVRENVTVATKVGFNPPHLKERSLDPDLIRRSVDESLDRLGIETIDLLYAHVDDPDTPQTAYMEAFADVVEAEKVRHLGASNFPAWRVARANRIAADSGWSRFECVQPRFSYLIPDRDAGFGGQLPATDELVDYCNQHDLTLLPYSPTLQGAYGRDDRPISEGYVRSENRLKMEVTEDLAERKGVDGNAVALAWMLARDQFTVPIIGCSTVEQLEANLEAAAIDFTDAERERLDAIESYGFDEWDLR